MFGSQAQTSRPSALRCQRQTSRCFETGIESRANRRTRLVAFGATMPDAMAGRTSRFAAAILSASFYTDRLHRPRRRESRRALRSSASPKIRGSPARHCDILASPPSECRHVILLPHRAAAEIAHGSCQERVHQPDTAAQPARPRLSCSRPDNLLDLRIADYQEPPALHISVTWRAYSCQ